MAPGQTLPNGHQNHCTLNSGGHPTLDRACWDAIRQVIDAQFVAELAKLRPRAAPFEVGEALGQRHVAAQHSQPAVEQRIVALKGALSDAVAAHERHQAERAWDELLASIGDGPTADERR